jgi:hypothetical protein
MAENNLCPVFDVPAVLAEDVEALQIQDRYAPAPMWDFERGDFVTDGANQTLYGSGRDAWILWCIKTILTQRWAHLGYSSNAGIESEEAFREPDRAAQESAFERTITEALLADPMARTLQVRDCIVDWGVDSLMITCTVVGTDGNSATVTAKLNNNN